MAEAETISLRNALSATEPAKTAQVTQVIPGRPTEALEIQENEANEEEREYLSGPKLWLNMTSLLMCTFLKGLDITIVAVAVPSITNEFKTLADIGWYNAAYGMVVSATVFFFGKLYSLFDTKKLFLGSIVLFWIGSIICTFAPSSKVFVFGRAISGAACAWQGTGMMNQLNMNFPLHKRPFWSGAMAFVGSCAMTAAPVVGGGLTQKFGWRACFGINIPLHFIAFWFSVYGMESSTDIPDIHLPIREKIKRMDLLSTVVIIPALTCLLMALQWGGSQYGWNDGRIIALLVVSGVMLIIFGYMQYRLQDRALLPPRIIKQRSILAGAWFNACCDGTLATTEYYISIYFQGVKGLSPAKSGLLGVPMIVGLAVASLISGFGTGIVGYYTPFMIATTVLAPIASGLLTTLDLDSQLAKGAGLLGMLGFAMGVGMQGPMMAVSTTLPTKDVGIGCAVTGFGAGIGSSLFISTAASLFKSRLATEVRQSSPGTNITTVETAGLSDIRKVIGPDRLKNVLKGYDEAVTQTLYIPLALTILSVIGSGFTEWRSVKKKKQ